MSSDDVISLVFMAVLLPTVAYLTWRGLARNEFRERGRWGWFKYRRYSLEWWSGTVLNLTFLGSMIFVIGLVIYKGEFR